MEDSGRYIQILVNTLQKQIDTLQEILELTKKQEQIADGPDFEEAMLEDTMNRKEFLITRLNELDDGFLSVYERVRKEVGEHREQHNEVLQELQRSIKICTDLSVEIKVLEERNRIKLTRRFAEKHKEYGLQQNAASVASRYHQTMHNMNVVDSYFFNKKN